MKKVLIPVLGIGLLIFAAGKVRAQHEQHEHGDMPPAQMDDMAHATTAMSEHAHGHEGHEHAMGPHMKMSALRSASTADTARAEEIVDTARKALERYKDVSAAEADGFEKFLPNVKQKM